MRLKSSFLTMITGIVSMAIIGVLGFIKIRYFIDLLGSEANGLIQMIYRILSYLSLAELGLGGAIIYKLYKPIADNDHDKISILINTANHYFKRIGFIILGFLVVFMFIIPLIIKDNTYPNTFLYLVFFLAGVPYAVEYLWYKKYHIILASDQKHYINNIVLNSSTILYDIFIIIALTQNISLIGYILISYPFMFYKGFILQKIYKKNYPYIKKTKKLDKESISLSKDVFVHNIGSAINNSADQIVLSAVNGLAFVSIYSSYFYIVKYLKDIASSILRSTLYSFGNLFAKKEEVNKKGYDIFKEFLSFSSFFAIIISVTFSLAIVPCIKIWIGKPEYILPFATVMSFVLLVYTNIITIPISVATGADGVFKETKYYSFLTTIVNVTLSLLLIKKYEIAGIVFATVFSTMFIWLPIVIKVIYKKTFFEHKTIDYYKQIIISLIITIGIILFTNYLNIVSFYKSSIINWLLVSGSYFVIVSLLVGLFYYVTDSSFRKFIFRCLNILKRRKK